MTSIVGKKIIIAVKEYNIVNIKIVLRVVKEEVYVHLTCFFIIITYIIIIFQISSQMYIFFCLEASVIFLNKVIIFEMIFRFLFATFWGIPVS